jgi:hypothetical protein
VQKDVQGAWGYSLSETVAAMHTTVSLWLTMFSSTEQAVDDVQLIFCSAMPSHIICAGNLHSCSMFKFGALDCRNGMFMPRRRQCQPCPGTAFQAFNACQDSNGNQTVALHCRSVAGANQLRPKATNSHPQGGVPQHTMHIAVLPLSSAPEGRGADGVDAMA